MAVLGSGVATLVDIAKRLDPDGRPARIAERLNQSNEILDDMIWVEGNLPTGDRTTVRVGLPAVAFRSINQGVPRSKSQVGQYDEGAAQLAGASQVDRTAAELSGDPAKFRLDEAQSFFEAMNQEQAATLFDGNASASPKEFTGFGPRFNSLSGATAEQIIDAGGTGTDNRSIWIINWSEDGITGIYPKGSKAGLTHMDTTANLRAAADGYPIGDLVQDESGNDYLAYTDFFQWDAGLAGKDPRDAVRIANIDFSLLTKDRSTGADIEDLIIQGFHRLGNVGPNAAIYVPKPIGAMMHRQAIGDTRGGRGVTGFEDIGGRKVPAILGLPIRSVDALNVDEARVIA